MQQCDRHQSPTSPSQWPILKFGEFEFSREREELRKGGRPVRLPVQPGRLLALLVGRPGELVTREEIREWIWGADTFVDFEQGINHCVRQLRAALGDDSDSPRFIETVPRRGYRFRAEVDTVAPDREDRRARTSRRLGWLVAGGTIALGLAVVSLLALLPSHRGARGSVAVGERPMLAVLPFQSLDGDGDGNFLGQSFTEELITELGRRYSGRLGVIARTSATRYAASGKGLDEIGRELGVGYVLEGSVRRDRARVRIAAQLIRASDRSHLWAGVYDRELTDLLEIQREVGEKIARALALKILPGGARSLPALATNPAAYEAYLKARYELSRPAPDSAKLALNGFQKAIDLDPGFAPAHAGLAQAHLRQPIARRKAVPPAREAAIKALALDDSLADAHRLLAGILFYYDLDREAARKEFERAIELNPGDPEAHHDFAAYYSVQGRHAEALAEVQKARALDPLEPMINSDVGWYYYFARRFDEAIEHSRRTLHIEPGFYWANRCILFSLVQKGDLPGAVAHARREMTEEGAPEEALKALDGVPASSALRTYWEWDLHRKTSGRAYRSPADTALIRAALGDRDEAIKELEEAYERRFGWVLPFLRVEPMADPLRGDPRFQDLLARIDTRSRLAAHP